MPWLAPAESGTVVVKPGDRVGARQVVAETFMPGDIAARHHKLL
jgi:hypothetical protein